MIPQHLSLTNEHYTPAHVVEAARNTLDWIDLDPASCAEANERVGAKRYIGLPDDGLAHDWSGRVFLNPPGGRTPDKWRKRYKTASNATAWWRKLTEEFGAKRTVEEAIFIGFTLELLRSAQGDLGYWAHPFDFAICVPSERLCFGGNSPHTRERHCLPGAAPGHIQGTLSVNREDKAMTLHEALRNAGFATEAKPWLETQEMQIKMRRLEEELVRQGEGEQEDVEALKDKLDKANEELDELADRLNESEADCSAMKLKLDAIRDAMEAA